MAPPKGTGRAQPRRCRDLAPAGRLSSAPRMRQARSEARRPNARSGLLMGDDPVLDAVVDVLGDDLLGHELVLAPVRATLDDSPPHAPPRFPAARRALPSWPN